MTCPNCGNQAPSGSAFCNGCGARLAQTCPSCGVEPPPDSRFCNACGTELQGVRGLRGSALGENSAHPPNPQPLTPNPLSYTPKHLADRILNSRSALEGERKQVTVLFADVKGSMELAEQLDPEEWHKILDRFFQILTEGVHRFEGTVNQYTGDGIMALFGAPIAHEDHAQRACYAALHLRDALRSYADELRVEQGVNFSVRMGLNSGEVIVGRIGDDLRMDYTAQGHTVGLAARMEQLAEPGKILATEETAKLASGYLRFRDLGASKIRGARQTLRLFELESSGDIRTRLDVSRARGLSDFIGRGEELAALEEALQRCRDGHGNIVGLVGDAGLGKSRLCYEFAQRTRAAGITVRAAQAVAHGKLVPFMPMLDLTRSCFGIDDRDTPDMARSKVAGNLVLRHPKLVPLLPVLLDFLGVADPSSPPLQLDPDARQQQLLDMLPRVLLADVDMEPNVLLVEDLHWLDGGSERLLAALAEAVPRSKTFLLVNYRPEYRAAWMSDAGYREMRLEPLGEELTAELIRHLLGTSSSLALLASQIQERALGNPFFVEEMIRELVESNALVGSRGAYELAVPIDGVEVPGTVQSILAARIDRLAEREKTILQAAAVIGRRFSRELLEQVLQIDAADMLATLIQREFIDEETLYPNVEYSFVHPLTQEVAYGSQLGDQRRRTHAAVARALEQSTSDGVDERAALIAHHWEAAGEALAAARWYRRAGKWVSARSTAEGLLHFRRVRDLLLPLAESQERDTLLAEALTQVLYLGSYEGITSEEARQCFVTALPCCERIRDVAALIPLYARYAFFLGGQGDMDECMRYSHEAIRIADESGDPIARVQARAVSVYLFVQSGQLSVALQATDEGLALLEPVDAVPIMPDDDPVVVLRVFRGWALAPMGRFAEAERVLRQALERAEKAGNLRFMALAHAALSQVAENQGRLETMRTHARRTLELGLQFGSPRMQNLGYLNWALYLLRSGQPAEALVQFEEMRCQVEKYTVTREAEAMNLAGLARAQADTGDRTAGRNTVALAVDTAVRNGTRYYEAVTRLERARILLGDGPAAREEVAEELRRAERLVDETAAEAFRPMIRLEQAHLARQMGDRREVARLLADSRRLFAEIDATGHLERLDAMER